jgi:hypothetical protein
MPCRSEGVASCPWVKCNSPLPYLKSVCRGVFSLPAARVCWPCVVRSMLAGRMIAIMAGESAVVSQYAQERFVAVREVQHTRTCMSDRQRRIMSRRIEQENEVS